MDLLHCLYIFKLIAWLWKQKSKTQWKWNTFKMSEQTDFGYFCLNCYFKIRHYLSRVFNESHGYSSWVVMLLMLLLSLSKCSLVLVPTSVSMETETDCCLQEGRGTLTRRRLWFRRVNLIDLTIYVNCVPTFENSASHWSHKNPHSLFYPFLFFFLLSLFYMQCQRWPLYSNWVFHIIITMFIFFTAFQKGENVVLYIVTAMVDTLFLYTCSCDK